MRSWNHFEYSGERPELDRVLTEADREELEEMLAVFLGRLLSVFGTPTEIDCDVCECLAVEDPQTFAVLELDDPIELQDGSTLSIGQLPNVSGRIITEAGYHSIEHVDRNGRFLRGIVVVDPVIEPTAGHKRVMDTAGGAVEAVVLDELCDIIACETRRMIQEGYDENDPHLDASLYPVAVSSLDFEAIVADF